MHIQKRRLDGRLRPRGLAVAAAAALAASPASAMVIKPIFDSSITSLTNAATIENAFQQAASFYSNSFADNVTVNVGVSWGKVGGQALPSNAVGASMDSLYGYFSYNQI